jgi:hypothetical protein
VNIQSSVREDISIVLNILSSSNEAEAKFFKTSTLNDVIALMGGVITLGECKKYSAERGN